MYCCLWSEGDEHSDHGPQTAHFSHNGRGEAVHPTEEGEFEEQNRNNEGFVAPGNTRYYPGVASPYEEFQPWKVCVCTKQNWRT